MRAEVLGVGTELLLGDIVNTNAAYIAQRLTEIGVDCHAHAVVGDNEERIADAIAAALARADAVIVTGGLGPTQDDVTREAIARLTGRLLRRDDAIAGRLRERFRALGRAMPEMNLRQADVPEGGEVIEATFGTAPGLIVPHASGVIYAIPGVPAEMEDMMQRAVLPDLARRAGGPARITSRVVRVAGVAESAVAETLAPVWDRLGGDVTMAFLAGGGEVRVRLTAKASDDEAARALLGDAVAEVARALGDAVTSVADEPLEAVVGARLREIGYTLACAESLTGGALGARITRVPGASDYFLGSIVAYSTGAKVRLLGVPEDLVAREGPVSGEVAVAMASGTRERLGADVGVALTGVAGPAELGRPVGTVFVAVASPTGEAHREVRLPGNRETVRVLATSAALNLVRLQLREVRR